MFKKHKGEINIPTLVIVVVLMMLLVAFLPAINTAVRGGNWTISSAITFLADNGYVAYSGPNIVSPTGRSATFVVAASDASTRMQNQCDYICDGTADDVEIQAAIDASTEGTVKLSEGTFVLASGLTGVQYVDLEGSGWGTVLDVSALGSATRAITMASDTTVSSLKIEGAVSGSIGDSTGIITADDTVIKNVWLDQLGAGIDTNSSTNVSISQYKATNILDANDWAYAFHATTNSDGVYLSDFYFETCNRGCEIEDGAKNIHVSNGYIKSVRNYQASGQEPFVLDVHSHNTGGGVDNISYRNIYLEDCFNGFSAEGGNTSAHYVRNILFENITVASPYTGGGVSYVKECDGVIIRQCKLDSTDTANSRTLTIWQDAKNVLIEDCDVTVNKAGCSAIGGAHSGTTNLIIQNNSITVTSGLAHILLDGNGNYTNAKIINNRLFGTGATSGYSIDIEGDNCIVENNYIEDSTDDIHIQTGADNTKVRNNLAQVYDEGTDTVVDFNTRSVALDLSGAAIDNITFSSSPSTTWLCGYTVTYSEASSADAGVTIRIGQLQADGTFDDDYYDSVTSETSEVLGYSKRYYSADLTNADIATGESITVGTAGGKTGTGEVIITLYISSL